MNKQNLYWVFQFTGWFIYTSVNYLSLPLFQTNLQHTGLKLTINFFTGIVVTHLYRNIIKSQQWYKLKFVKLVVQVVLGAALATVVFIVLQVLLETLALYLFQHTTNLKFNFTKYFPGFGSYQYLNAINSYLVIIVWSVLYFIFHYFENYRSAQLKAASAEAQLTNATLQNLRNQINPHFLFNALNSIKSLAISQPEKSRTATTLLSEILRYSLNSEKNTTVAFETELHIVEEYLQLETIRFGNRLGYKTNIEATTLPLPIPPVMLLTLAENAIKHGISQRVDGGEIIINSYVNDYYHIVELLNEGQLNTVQKGTGIGVENTLRRLQITFGPESVFKLQNKDGQHVIAQILIPLQNQSGI
ncbi:MAG: histidine kinase [Bacteroidia bacterium]|nr:histidine kinase [Bacteroidia bacterium]